MTQSLSDGPTLKLMAPDAKFSQNEINTHSRKSQSSKSVIKYRWRLLIMCRLVFPAKTS